MHEVSIVTDLLSSIYKNAQINNLKSVSKIVLKVGELSNISEESIRFAYDSLCDNTICQKAILEIIKTAGDELIIDRIEGE